MDVSPEVRSLVTEVIENLKEEIAGVGVAERIRSGFEVAILGAPNVGKSTLLNALAGRDAAITSEIAGTTRDVIEVRMDLLGFPVTLLDTAGLRSTTDKIEAMGVERAKSRAKAADIRVFLVEPGAPPPIDPMEGDIILSAKSDVHNGEYPGISGQSGEGIDGLVQKIGERLKQRAAGAGIATRVRHRQAMIRGLDALNAALVLLESKEDLSELIAEELRNAVRALDSLVGRVDIENVLDEIFASFCLGK